jgi:hypothetical protein
MSHTWKDLTSKSDNFFNTLPLFNKKGSLEDNYSFKYTAKPSNGKFSLSANHTNGSIGKVEFSGSGTYTNYYNTELGYKINNKPGVELTAKLTDDLIPLSGSSFHLHLNAIEKEERAILHFKYAANALNLVLGASIPLPHRLFNLPVEEGDDVNHNKTVSTEILYKVCESGDYYVGLDATYKLPNENETPRYDVKGVVATKSSNYEGGFFFRKSVDKENSTQFGGYSTSETEHLTISSHFAYVRNKNEFSLDNFVSFPSHGSNHLLGLQVSGKKTSLSFGIERNIDSNTKISFAYAYLISQTVDKRSAVRFNLELSN